MAEETHYNVTVKVTRVDKPSYHPGKISERVIDDVVNMTVRASTEQDAVAKAITLLNANSTAIAYTEFEEQPDGH